MRTPQKAKKIYEKLRMDILQRRYAPGALLPAEVDFAVQLGVSRDTVRLALAMLAEDSLVRRVRGHGTYVSETVRRKKITFLLPYAYNIENNSGFLAQLHHGAIEGARECDCELESLAISPSNDPSDIDWSKLYNLNSESLVIASGFWFKEIFPFLLASRCKVAVIHDQLRQPPSITQALAGWCDIVKTTNETMRNMILQLLDKGCRKPLFLLSYLDEKESYSDEIIRSVCADYSPAVKPTLVNLPSGSEDKELDRLVNQALSGGQFDGCLLANRRAFKILRTYLPQIPCGVFDLPQQSITADKHTFYSEFPLFDIARDTVHKLIAENASQGCIFKYDSKIQTEKGSSNL